MQAMVVTSLALLLAACGGSGSSTPAPTVKMSFSQPKVAVGASSTLTWSSTNATSCVASGAWSGAQITSGSAVEAANVGGAETFTLTCSGPGGQTSQSATLAVPIPLQVSSYLNKIAAANAIGPQPLPAEVAQGNAVAFADFFQDGTYSMVTHTCGDKNCGANGSNGTIRFYKMINGQWVDHTSDILTNAVGCLHPRKAIVADFNGDGKPDVFFACHGFDAAPFPGEQPHMLLSQPNGTYSNVTLPFTGYFHGASAADFNGHGFADIAVTDTTVNRNPYFLVNNGDGTFHQDFTRIPTLTTYDATGALNSACGSACFGEIYTAELIDFDNSGKLDLFLGGNSPNATLGGNWIPTILKNRGDNTYSQSNETLLPYDPANQTTALDILSVNGAVYLNSVFDVNTTAVYGHSEIQKIVGSNSSQIWSGNSNFPNGMTWLNWIIPYQGKIDSLDSGYGVSVVE